MVIIVYSKEEVKKLKTNKEENVKCPEVNNACIKDEVSEPLIETKKTKDEKNTKISINTATEKELETLTGIGESKAKAIISYREKEGAFKAIEEITKVSGIGQSVFDKIKNNITT